LAGATVDPAQQEALWRLRAAFGTAHVHVIAIIPTLPSADPKAAEQLELGWCADDGNSR
jgi:hypothetical protein